MGESIETRINRHRKVLKGIGVLEIIGGVVGLFLILRLFFSNRTADSKVNTLILIPIAFYAFSIFAGMRLMTKMENGISCSKILQYIQVASFSLGGYTVLLLSGGHLLFTYNLTNQGIGLHLSLIASKFRMSFAGNTGEEFISINILAIIFLFVLEKTHEKIEDELEKRKAYRLEHVNPESYNESFRDVR